MSKFQPHTIHAFCFVLRLAGSVAVAVLDVLWTSPAASHDPVRSRSTAPFGSAGGAAPSTAASTTSAATASVPSSAVTGGVAAPIADEEDESVSDIAAAIDDFRAWFKDIEPAPVVLHESAVPLVDDVDTTDDDIPAELRARIDALLSSITVGH